MTGMETVALTYDELAARARISDPSARRIVNKRRWKKIRGNDGRALIHVPVQYLEQRSTASGKAAPGAVPPPDPMMVPPPVPMPVPPPGPDAELLARLDRMQAELVEMAQQLGGANTELVGMKAAMDELRQDRDKWREMAERLSERRPGLFARLFRRAG